MNLLVEGTRGPLAGEVQVPNSKYHAHRALILASLAPGTSRIRGCSDARHVRYTVDVLRALGTKIETDGETTLVTGGPYRVKRKIVSVGSSGSTLYFMIGLASHPIASHAHHLQNIPAAPGRSVARGARGNGRALRIGERLPPIAIRAPGHPRGLRILIAGTYLSQWISGLLLLAPFASEPTVIVEAGFA